MKTVFNDPIEYSLLLDGENLSVNSLIGKQIQLQHTGAIFCSSCGTKIKKTFQDGLCFKCFQSAPEASECILRPELCRAHLGEGRDIEWEQANHNQPHVVYLAASDTVKVGVTRATQVPFRWMDQGAASAIRLAETPNRYEAGKLEVALKSFFTDKTNWQRMLKNEIDESIDLEEEKWSLHDQLPSDLTEFFSENDEIIQLHYPVEQYPEKIKSLSLDKTPLIEGKLSGIKGQYLLFEDGSVINIRKHTGYEVVILVVN
ncbi:DUF2797 domain-containing protein [Crocinitomicaceae bacterium CZZ-1]|uniref:DUF2797 domain-containing protein n=1 Tax=Taishania pollutisoli TaxID=2766479 RepID=A0A8J6PKT5_9FLAO|nr:DUF2797 domain-containing protein [Taishania pollutisoli]MBC9812660.1 DUF2797 domain-containing protein [Taishania pollutisoli]MBX2949185.1 DUF2797 domain-containing protein [Crocinitomicaceae bacterium]